MKSAKGGRCTPGAGRGARGDGSPGRGAHTPRGWMDALGAEPTHRALPGSPQLPLSFSWYSGAWLFTGKSREQERTRRLTPKSTGTTWFRRAGSASRPALRSCETGAPGPAPGPTWGAWGSGRPPHTTAPEGQGWGAEVTLRLKGLVKSSLAAFLSYGECPVVMLLKDKRITFVASLTHDFSLSLPPRYSFLSFSSSLLKLSDLTNVKYTQTYNESSYSYFLASWYFSIFCKSFFSSVLFMSLFLSSFSFFD